MIQLSLDWREVLWWMQGGMAGSHLRWIVYEDMVNKVWPQCSEQERRNIHYIMGRDLGTYWRNSDGDWKPTMDDVRGKMDDVSQSSAITHQPSYITDTTPWMYFRQVLARFDPDNQYAVTMDVKSEKELKATLCFTPKATIISCPTIITAKGCAPKFDLNSAPLTVRAYKWQNEYRINWGRRCDESRIIKVEKMEIPDKEEM